MNGMLKGLAGLIAGLALIGNSASADELPRSFEDYRNKGRVVLDSDINLYLIDLTLGEGNYPRRRMRELVKLGVVNSEFENNLRLRVYRVGKLEATEYFTYVGFDESGDLISKKEPFSYWFDVNGNEEPETGEVFFDPKQDGFNGNEEIRPQKDLI